MTDNVKREAETTDCVHEWEWSPVDGTNCRKCFMSAQYVEAHTAGAFAEAQKAEERIRELEDRVEDLEEKNERLKSDVADEKALSDRLAEALECVWREGVTAGNLKDLVRPPYPPRKDSKRGRGEGVKNSEKRKWADHIDRLIGSKTVSGERLRRRAKESDMRNARKRKVKP